MKFDTIAAIATALGEGGIGIIRVSGPDAITIVDKIYKGKNSLSTVDTHTIHYGHIIDSSGAIIDEVLISVFRTPKSYTMEDVVEINCHGGIMPLRRVLATVTDAGARLAEPGEFTKRAFLNGRIDLSQAEAVIDLIRSKTDLSMKAAMSQVQGSLSKQIHTIRQQLVELMAHIEVTIDYPEHDVEEVTKELVINTTEQAIDNIDKILATADQGKIIRDGISAAIIGRPNVGKSSLLNAMLKENRAIVTDIPGTTRDILEEYINVKGIPVKIIDTAGIRETEDIVEQLGVERSRAVMQDADLILFMLNVAEELTEYDITLLKELQGKQAIVILNKTDLVAVFTEDNIKQYVDNTSIISLSAKEEEGIEHLYSEIERLFIEESIKQTDFSFVTNTRHTALLKTAKAQLNEALNGVQFDVPMDMVTIDITSAWESLGEITGDTVAEGLLDQLFAQFCLGK
ncbi:tRNA uridine-5-carboxymethylaminomethyl(34) synthesis GTPase MnmE [Desulfuribacillus alkaliarsenatis]|uniref:tRNA modification GTPase MnmE n=1 Tax=Desulfuribacillus alkaliarsenatis TaxID=766136 RepID=A0A1E5G2L7_9FIRM|nr:tRNA uridine-5-carboxymethylaminomethyl(34) synthesis GTPase MnmE [Desulfuribacillus alkaliarsenatis]OEF97317.1 tRNA uridine-5-carboxymethylaminomethyl(34) synthesis GTPase MnmE [Desulfuribacillus alkaliarsenatis]